MDPVDAVRREVYGMRGGDEMFRRELWALAALVEAHRAEFEEFVRGLGETVSLDDRRRKRRHPGAYMVDQPPIFHLPDNFLVATW